VFGAVVIGIVLGTLVAIVRVFHSQTGGLSALNRICGGYLAIFRGTPLVVQLLIMYYIIFASINNGILVAIFTFGINSGAYVAEIVRAGIMAVDYGQTEAGRSLGLSAAQTMYKIVLPQAIKNILPALGNEFVTLVKETSIAGYVTVRDFAQAGEYIRSRTMEPYFSLLFIAVVYFLLVYGITRALRVLEKKLGKSDRM
jgi:His/Glu/Gln/Arg/opine family amino acid ABC transporter permease subunit